MNLDMIKLMFLKGNSENSKKATFQSKGIKFILGCIPCRKKINIQK